MSMKVQEINSVQSKVAKQNTPVDEKSCVKKDQPEIQQKQIVSFQGAQALKAAALAPSFASNPNFKDTFRSTMKSDKVPEMTMKTGKFNPSGEIIDKDLGIKIIFLGGSKIEGEEFKYVLPGNCQLPGEHGHKLSFSGSNKLTLTTFNLEPRTVDSVEEFKAKGLHEQAIMGDNVETVQKYKPSVVIPAGGFGTRFLNISGLEENKPSSIYPGGSRVIDNALSLAASAGTLDAKSKITYLSQAGEISGKNVIRINEILDAHGKLRNIEDGGGVAEALHRNILNSKKDMIILNADIFTNADVTRAYHALKTLPDAAMVIPYYPVPKERAGSFGMIAVEDDGNGNKVIEKFVEKPQDAEGFKKAEKAKIEGTNNYMANPGMYFLSKQVVEKLKEKGANVEAVGLGAKFVPGIVEMCNRGEIRDAKGNKMKVYTVPLESKGGRPAVWDDVGSAEAYVSRIRDVAHETKTNGTGIENKYYGIASFVLEDFTNSVDLNTGVICSPKEKAAFEAFKEKYGIAEDGIKGNVVVLPLDTK